MEQAETHTDFNPMAGICVAAYWHTPWLQRSLVKSCRAKSVSDAHFLFYSIDYSFLSWQISPEASPEPDKYSYNKQTLHSVSVYVYVWVFVGGCIAFPLPYVITHKQKTDSSKIAAYVGFVTTVIYKCLSCDVCVGSFFPIPSSPWCLSDMFDKWEKS